MVFNIRFVRLPPIARRLLLVGIDALFLPLSVWLSFWLRLAHPFDPTFIAAGIWLLPAVLLIGLPLYSFTGQYKGLMRYVGSQALYRLAGRNGLLVLLLATTGVMLRLPMPPRSSWILLCCCSLALLVPSVSHFVICFCRSAQSPKGRWFASPSMELVRQVLSLLPLCA